MSDPTGEGKIIGDHWLLITVIGAVIAGVAGFLRLVVNAIDSRIDERVQLSMSNGIGKKVADAVDARVAESLMSHTFDCPYKEKAQEHHDRLIEIEQRLLQNRRED